MSVRHYETNLGQKRISYYNLYMIRMLIE